MATNSRLHISPEEYLVRERAAEYKSEYLDGDIYALAGTSRWHNLIVTNLVRALATEFRAGTCETYSSEMRVRVSAANMYTYPDVVVVCGEPEFADSELDTLLNPTVIFEVLSRSTEAYDRGRKFEYYRSLGSLKEYVLVSQESARIDHYARRKDGEWLFISVAGLDSRLSLQAVPCTLHLAEVYERVAFNQDESSGHAGAAAR